MKNWLIYKILKEFKDFFVMLIRCALDFRWRIIGVIKEHNYDKRLGIETSECCVRDDQSLYKDAVRYQPSPYEILEKMRDFLKLTPEDIFIDVGCGKGRVVFFMAREKLKKVVGIELRKSLADIAKENLKNLKLKNSPVEILNIDAVSYDVKDGTVFFMFNPFGIETFSKVMDNIKNSLMTHPRKIRIAYRSAAHSELLDKKDWLVKEGQINNGEIIVWHNRL